MDATPDTPWSGRAVLHVDMDAFFASVEQLDHPEWRGRPVVVGGDPAKRGVVSAASYEARRFGVRSAMPSARAAALCPDAVWARPRGERYREVSLQVRAILGQETPAVQPTSIDEAYLDVTPGRHFAEDPVAVARRIQERVAALGVTCSIGVATSKTVAKIASDRDKPHGLTVVRPGTEAAFLAPLPVGLMPGVGSVTAARLERFGIATLGQLAALDRLTAEEVLGSWAPSLLERARGVDPRPVVENEPAKSVSNERTFAEDVHDAAEVRAALSALSARVTERLRRKGLSGRTVTVKVRYGDFTTRTVRRTVPVPTDDRQTVLSVAMDLLRTVWSPGVGVRLLGVGVSGFEERAVQLDLLGGEGAGEDPAKERLAASVDAVRERFGPGALDVGGRQRRPDARRPDTDTTRDGRST